MRVRSNARRARRLNGVPDSMPRVTVRIASRPTIHMMSAPIKAAPMPSADPARSCTQSGAPSSAERAQELHTEPSESLAGSVEALVGSAKSMVTMDPP